MSRESAFTFKVTGRVQGVGFRAFVQTSARQLQLCGWVKNHVDGSVIGLVQGDSGLVNDFFKLLHIGNRWSSVSSLNQQPIPPDQGLSTFEIRY